MGGSTEERRCDQHQQAEGNAEAGRSQLAQRTKIEIHGEDGEGGLTFSFWAVIHVPAACPVIGGRAHGAARSLSEQIHSLVTPLLFSITLGLKLVFECCRYVPD
jgi:hypothetical protein